VFLAYRVTTTSTVFQNAYGILVGGNNDRISSGLSVGTSWSTRTRTGGAGSAASTSAVSATDAGGAPQTDVFYVQAAVWDNSGATTGQLSKLLLPNGSVVTGTDTGGFPAPAFTPLQLNVGMLFTTPSAGTTFQGDIAELLVYKTGLGDTDLGSVFQYLGTKYGVTSASTLLAGDYNGDKRVDATDYIVWRNNLNGPEDSLLNRDPTNSGPINEGDYGFWRTHFGTSFGSGSSLGNAGAVPEPCTTVLAALGGLGLLVSRRRVRSA
jgi:hypothetical protein